MKICHVVGDSEYGGGSRVIVSLVRSAVAAGHQVSVVATNELLVESVEAAGGCSVQLDCVRRKINPVWDFFGCCRLSRHMRTQKYDLVHTHTSKGGIIGRVAARLAGIGAIVHTVHGFAFHEESRPAVVSLISTLEKVGGIFCDKVVTVSHFHRLWALDLGIVPAEKVVAIPNGIEQLETVDGFDRARFRNDLGVEPENLMILGLGRLASQKGYRYLLESIVEVVQTWPTCRLLIGGAGPLKSELAQFIELHRLNDFVTLLGFRSDIAELYLAADIVVQPSLWEGMSISLLEALSLGRPVITTTIRSNIEVVGESRAAILVPAKDPGAMAEAILQLAADPAKRTKIGARARDLYVAKFAESEMCRRYLDLYEELNRVGSGER